MKRYTLINDGAVTCIAVFVFGGLFLIANAYHDETVTHGEESAIVTAVPVVTPPTEKISNLVPPISTLKEDVTPLESNKEDVELFLKEESITPSDSDSLTSVPSVVIETPLKTEVEKETPLPVTFADNASYAEELVALIEQHTNAFRIKEGLSPLEHDIALEKSSDNYSESMKNAHSMSHTNKAGCDLDCRFEGYGYKALSWGENLATMNFSHLPSAQEVATTFMKEWQKSAGHRHNLLSSTFTHQGIGVSISKNDLYVTVHFAKPLE